MEKKIDRCKTCNRKKSNYYNNGIKIFGCQPCSEGWDIKTLPKSI